MRACVCRHNFNMAARRSPAQALRRLADKDHLWEDGATINWETVRSAILAPTAGVPWEPGLYAKICRRVLSHNPSPRVVETLLSIDNPFAPSAPDPSAPFTQESPLLWFLASSSWAWPTWAVIKKYIETHAVAPHHLDQALMLMMSVTAKHSALWDEVPWFCQQGANPNSVFVQVLCRDMPGTRAFFQILCNSEVKSDLFSNKVQAQIASLEKMSCADPECAHREFSTPMTRALRAGLPLATIKTLVDYGATIPNNALECTAHVHLVPYLQGHCDYCHDLVRHFRVLCPDCGNRMYCSASCLIQDWKWGYHRMWGCRKEEED